MNKRLLTFGLISAIAGAVYGQQQVTNNGFETWEDQGTGDEEPVSWSNMNTGDLCFFCGFGASQRVFPDNGELAPGTSGGTSARIETTAASGNTVNGTLTTGRIHAPSTTPADGYTRTHLGTAGNTNNDDWEELISQSPDSLVFWAKYVPDPAMVDQARVSAELHTNYDQRNPYSNDPNGNANVDANLALNFTTGGVWQRMAIPWDYSGPQTSHSRILVTFTATSQPGASPAGDYDQSVLWVDDMYLVYNVNATYATAAICAGEDITVNFTTNGTTTAGRTFTAELSDAAGNFGSPVAIGSTTVGTGVGSGSITATIPGGTAAGAGYRIRVTGNHDGYSPVNTGAQFTINAAPAAPTAGTNASYCAGDTPADMTATAGSGGTLTWYDNAGLTSQIGTGGTQTPGTTLGTTTYYVTETASGCESAASTVQITFNAIPGAPTAGGGASYCAGDTPADMTATAGSGGTLTWYDNAGLTSQIGTGTTQTPGTGAGTTTYYVTETVAGCESASSSVAVTFNALPTAGTLTGTNVSDCVNPNGSVSLSGSTGTSFELFIAGGASTGQSNGTGNFTGLNAGDYEVVVTDGNNCSSTTNSVTVGNASAPSAPTAGTDATYCEGDTPTDLTATAGAGGTLTWYLGGNVEGNGTTLTPNTASAGTLVYTVTETVTNCESAPTTIVITVNPNAVAGTANPSASTSCTSPDGQVAVTGDNGTSYELFTGAGVSVTTNTTGSFTGLDAGDYYVEVTNSCGMATTATVTVNGPAGPTAGTIATVPVSDCQTPNGEVNVTGSNGTSYELFDTGNNSQGSNATGMFTGLSQGDYYVVITDGNGCTTTTSTETVGNNTGHTVSIAPTAQQDLNINETGATLTATESSTATSREWKYTTTSGSGYMSFAPTETGATYDPMFTTVGTYYVVCESVISGCTVMSSEVIVEVTDSTAAIVENTKQEIKVYSFENQVVVNMEGVNLDNPIFRLVSLDGRVVLNERLNNGTINQFNTYVPVGVYVFHIVANDGTADGKIMLK